MLNIEPSRAWRSNGASSSHRSSSLALAYFFSTSVFGPTWVSVSMTRNPFFIVLSSSVAQHLPVDRACRLPQTPANEYAILRHERPCRDLAWRRGTDERDAPGSALRSP